MIGTVVALAGRDLRRFFRQPSRIFGSAAQPLILWAVLGAGLGGIFRPTGGSGGNGGSGTTTGGAGGAGGSASAGGGLSSVTGTLSATNSTFGSNVSGSGGAGGSGGPGATAGGNGASGGAGGDGGGVSVSNPTSSSLLSVTAAGNIPGAAGAAGSGGTGPTAGSAGTAGTAGSTGGVFDQGSTTTLRNTLLASNGGGNCSGSVLDGGHNLRFAGGGCPATFASGDPNLGPLQNNGGPSATVSLQPGSAAIDKVPPSGAGCPATDHRGVPRPSGPACDIGAYEVAAPKATTLAATKVGTTVATFNGTVTANAGDATVQFEFGKSTKYGSLTAVQHVSGVTSTPVSVKLTGLKANTIYHYRLLVTAMDGATKGTDHTFNTTPPPLLGKLAIGPSSFRAGAPGATVRYTDSQASSVTFTVFRAQAGVKRGKGCVAPPRHGRLTHKCTRFVKVGSFSRSAHAGRNSFRFAGRVGGRALAVGSYRLDATPRANRLTGVTASATFKITK